MTPVVIGDATLYLGDCREILPTLGRVDAVITDPPYSARTHAGHDLISRKGEAADESARNGLGYAALSIQEAEELAASFVSMCDGWIVWMTDHTLAPAVLAALTADKRTTFAPLPFYQAGRSVRISGDGPCSWTDWIIASRTTAQVKWGTLPGGYIAGPGCSDKARMGGKPTALMERIVSDYSRQGQTVLDSHMGAGTTGVACVRTGRTFIGCEIDRGAFDLACERIEQAHSQGRMFKDEGFPGMNAKQMGIEA